MAVKRSTPCVCAVDLGTSWIKAGIFSADGRLIVSESTASPSATMWHDMQTFSVAACIDAVFGVLKHLTARADRECPGYELLSLSASTQRATLSLSDERGTATTPAICWHDTASQAAVESFSSRMDATTYRRLSGLPPLFALSLFKILHLRELGGDLISDATRFLPLHASFMSALGARRSIVDPSNASATGMLDIRAGEWCRDILEAAELKEEQLPAILPAGSVCGRVTLDAAEQTGLPPDLPLVVGGGDQQCSALATGCTRAGRASVGLGSAGFLTYHTTEPKTNPEHPLYCMPHVVPNQWVMEGVCSATGITLDWTRDVFSVGSHEELDRLVTQSPPGANRVRFFAHLAGTGAPDYVSDLTRGFDILRPTHTRADLLRAVVEGACFETCRAVEVTSEHDALTDIILTGNVCRHAVVLDIISATLGREIRVFPGENASLHGAAILAASVDRSLVNLTECSGPWMEPNLPVHQSDIPRDSYDTVFPAYCRAVSSRIAAVEDEPDGDVPLTAVMLPKSLGREPSELIRKSLDLANVAFYSYTLEGRVTFMDRASLRILDLEGVYPDPGQAIGKNIGDLFIYAEEPRSLRRRILEEGAVSGTVYHLKTLSGEDRWTLHDSFLDRDPDTGEEIINAMVRDVTDEKRAESALRQSHERLRSLATRMSEIRERERTRVARDLHDGLGQHLYAIRMLISSARASACNVDCPKTETLATIDHELGDILQATRDLIVGLRPPELDSHGLAVALEHELERIAEAAGIRWHFDSHGDDLRQPSTAMATDLFRMAQEALMNVVRHAKATRADVTLSITPEDIKLCVTDDGKGVANHDLQKEDSFGIAGMRERALAWRGDVTLESNEPHGTTLCISLPIDET